MCVYVCVCMSPTLADSVRHVLCGAPFSNTTILQIIIIIIIAVVVIVVLFFYNNLHVYLSSLSALESIYTLELSGCLGPYKDNVIND